MPAPHMPTFHTLPGTQQAPTAAHARLGAGHGRQSGCSTPKTRLCPPTLTCSTRAQLSVPCAAPPAQAGGSKGSQGKHQSQDPPAPAPQPAGHGGWGHPAPRCPCPLPIQLGFPIHLCWDQRAAAGTLVPSAVGGCRRVYLTIKSSFHLLQQLRVLGGVGAGERWDLDRCVQGWDIPREGRGAGFERCPWAFPA